MKTNRSVKKSSTKTNINKSYILISKPRDNSFLLNDQVIQPKQQKSSKETASTHRSNANSKLKINPTSNLRFRNVVQSVKNNKRDNSQKEFFPRSNSRANSSNRSLSQEGNQQPQKPIKKHARQRSQNLQQVKKKRQQLPSQEESRIKKKQFVIQDADLESPIISHTELTKRDQFFENGLKELQQELLVAKSELYEQIYKTDCLQQKYNLVRTESQSFQLKFEKEKENNAKLQQRSHKFAAKYKQKKDEVTKIKEEFERLVEERNDEINKIRESIDQSMAEFFKKGEKAAFLSKDLSYKLSQLQKLLREEKGITNHRQIYQVLMDAMILGDKVFEIIRIYDINGKLTSIDYQTMDGQQTTIDIQNENSICNFYNNHMNGQTNDQCNFAIQKGEFKMVDQQQNQIDFHNQMIEEMKLKIEQFQNENCILREERDLFVKQLQKLESSNKNQEKIIQFMNQAQNQQSSFQSNTHQYSTAQDMKSGSSQVMAPLLLSGTETHFHQQKPYAKTNQQQMNNLVDTGNLIQSDPGMQYYFNQISNEKSDYNDKQYNQIEPYAENKNIHQIQSKVPPLMIKDPLIDSCQPSSSGIRTNITSTTNQANITFKNKIQALSPASTLSMQHIQLSNYRSPNNNASNFTLCTNGNVNDYGQQQYYQQQQQQIQQQQLQYQSNLNQFLYEGKVSGRSHETSTFQQHQDFLESLKEVVEEAEDEDNISKNKSLISYNDKGRYDQHHQQFDYNENRIRTSNKTSPYKNESNKENNLSSSALNTNDYDSIPVDKIQKSGRYNMRLGNKDTITTSSQILSERTLNLKKEITNLDEEILLLQNSLQNAITKRQINNNQ